MSAVGGAGLPTRLRRAARPAARAVRGVRRRRHLRRALEAIRRAGGERLVLLYHRIEPRDEARYEIVRTVPLHLFREQLEALDELATIEPLQRLLEEQESGGPLRIALTFDDDYAAHPAHALPVLRELDLHGTFFLSGRALHGLGGYWFERLEALVVERGAVAAADLLDLRGVPEPQLPLRCEGDDRRLELIDRHAPPGPAPLDRDGIRSLAEAGMSIGFHTLHHPVLPRLDDAGIRSSLTEGREELAALVGRPLEWLSYPHGKADDRTVALTREAGYRAAWTTQPRAMRSSDGPYRFGRWEPQPLSTDEVLILLGGVLERRHASTGG